MTIVFDRSLHSRRQFFAGMAILAGGATALATMTTPSPAAAKVGPADVGYQTAPKGTARCDNCLQWQGPASCKVVSGAISPHGWCSIWAHKS
jgi:hypothetical protein